MVNVGKYTVRPMDAMGWDSVFKILLVGGFFTNPFEKYEFVKLDRIYPGKTVKMVKIKNTA